MAKMNCWEFKKCGREPGGAKVKELGACPAAQPNAKANGLNNGKAAGRICWAVVGTLCGGKVQGEFARKQATCMFCEFFNHVKKEEGAAFCFMLPGQVYKRPEK